MIALVPRIWTEDRGVVVREVIPETTELFLVETRPERRPLGVVRVYSADPSNGHAYLTVARFSQEGPSLAFALGVAQFVDSLFATQDYRKLYAEVSESRLDQFRSGLGRYFIEDGRLRHHSWVGDRFEDLVLLSCTRERWALEGRPLIERLRLRRG